MPDLDLVGHIAYTADQEQYVQDYHQSIGPAHNAFNRMKKAYDAGHGVRLTWNELAALNRTIIGEIWEQPDPRIVADGDDT